MPEDDYVIEIGKADIKREGTDVTVITYGRMLQSVEEAETLSKENINVEIIDLRTLYPLDKETIVKSVCKTGRVLICHEATKTGGLGGEISALITESESFDYLDAPVKEFVEKMCQYHIIQS